jgi:adenine/guanine/hypoxanthine permease
MKPYGWARGGDVNAFFGLMLDNVAVMVLLVGAISDADPLKHGGTTFTQEFVLTRMIPPTALGVLVGDLVYTWMAFRLARRTGRSDVTAMPLGLDTPSTFGVAFLVLLPVLQARLAYLQKEYPGESLAQLHPQAMQFAWHVGLAVLVLVGVFKVACAPLGNAVRRWVPRAGLLGSLAAIALALIAFLPLLMDIGTVPVVGLLSLTVILVTLVAHRALPFKFPGALAAVLVGVGLYWACWGLDRAGVPLLPPGEPPPPRAPWQMPDLLPILHGDAAWWGDVLKAALAKAPVALPFALATIVGGIDCTESAAAAGDEYDTRAILLVEGVASVLAGLMGGVIQTTPYIGHPAYKKMGGRAAYVLATALFVGVVGYFGWFPYLFEWLPKAAMFPILVFVGLEITAQSFHATPGRHYPALALAVLPALAYLITIPLGMATPRPGSELMMQTLRCLANGFIVTGLLWAAALASLLDGRYRLSAAYFAVAGVCAFFGIIHSPLAGSPIDLPGPVVVRASAAHNEALPAAVGGVAGGPATLVEVPWQVEPSLRSQTPYHWTAAYALAALLLVGLSFFRSPGEASGNGEGGKAPA